MLSVFLVREKQLGIAQDTEHAFEGVIIHQCEAAFASLTNLLALSTSSDGLMLNVGRFEVREVIST